MNFDILKTIALGVGIKFAADEARDVIAWLPKKLISVAAKRFPEDMRGRMEEEWLAHCMELPGGILKCCHGLGCLKTSINLNQLILKAGVWIVFWPAFQLIIAKDIIVLFAVVLREGSGLKPSFNFAAPKGTPLHKTKVVMFQNSRTQWLRFTLRWFPKAKIRFFAHREQALNEYRATLR